MNSTQNETAALQTVSNTHIAENSRSHASSLMMDVATMESLMRVAELMAGGRSTVPKHLQGNPADCMADVMQSMQWGMNPFAVAQKTHVVNGTLGYEAQLVNAVVQESRSIQGRFHYEYKGTSPTMECRVGAVMRGEQGITWGEWINESSITTKNSPLWKVNPKQQIGYLQVKNWARLYTPGAILGVYTPDEVEQFAEPRTKSIDPATGEILPPALPECTDENFAKNLPAWRTLIESGRKTADQIIATVSSKATLTDEQTAILRATVVTTIDAE